MKKCLNFISLAAVVVVFVAFLGACQSSTPAPAPVATSPATVGAEPEAPTAETPAETESGFRIALIINYGGIDDGSFNEGAWNGILNFARSNNLTHQFIQPAQVSDAEYLNSISLAIQGGAEVIVTPGFLFSSAIYEAQDMFPETNFILLDAEPSSSATGNVRIGDNTVSILYSAEQAGFLAGYAAVHEGFRNLGFMGGIAVPAVVHFGHGFVQGAEYAAANLGLAEGEVTINYTYLGTFSPDPAIATQAAAWYASGTEIIFVAAGGAGFSVMSAAEDAGTMMIGVDIDQANDSETVLTSALKELSVSVYDMLEAHFNGTFPGGQLIIYDAAVDGVGLPLNTSRFQTFTQQQYDEIFARLASNEIIVNNDIDIQVTDLDVSLINLISMN